MPRGVLSTVSHSDHALLSETYDAARSNAHPAVVTTKVQEETHD
jgi:hypothetical protein